MDWWECNTCNLTIPNSLMQYMPKPEPWRPRTKDELADYWEAHYENLGAPLQWGVRQRTADIVRMLEEEAERAAKVEHVYYANPALHKMARRIRSLE